MKTVLISVLFVLFVLFVVNPQERGTVLPLGTAKAGYPKSCPGSPECSVNSQIAAGLPQQRRAEKCTFERQTCTDLKQT